MPPLGPFLDHVLWFGVFAALAVAALRWRTTTPDGWDGLRASGKSALSSIAEFVGPRAAGPRQAQAVPPHSDVLDRWYADELARVEDERRRLDARHQELSEMIARMRTQTSAPGIDDDAKPI